MDIDFGIGQLLGTRLHRLGAGRAQHTDQALGDDAVQRRNQVIGIDLHMQKTANHVEHVVGMHRGEYQMAGQRRLHGDLRRFRVTDFADHDLVRVMTQNGAQATGEIEALLLIHRDLQHAGQLIFDGVFDGDDLVLAPVDFRERGIQRRRLAAAGRASDQQHAIGLGRQAADAMQGVAVEAHHVKAQAFQAVAQGLLVEYAQYGVLTPDAGHDRHPDVDFTFLPIDLETAVLWHPAFGDIEFRQHLDARDQLLGSLAPFDGAGKIQGSVDAVLDAQPALAGFDVNVAGPRLQTVVQGRAQQADDGAAFLGNALQRQFLAAPLGSRDAGARKPGIESAHPGFFAGQVSTDYRRRRQPPIDPAAQRQKAFQPIAQTHIKRIGGHGQVSLAKVKQQYLSPHIVSKRGQRQGQQLLRQITQTCGAQAEGRSSHLGGSRFVQAMPGLQTGQHRRQAAANRQLLSSDNQSLDPDRFVRSIHWKFPASSKIGIYSSSTMPPITAPMPAISKGSNRRLKVSTRRPISSS